MINWAQLPSDDSFPLFHLEFFPCVEYLVKISQYNKITINADESFPKQTYRNRCVILSSNGIQNIIVPIKRDKTKKLQTKEVEISYSENWGIRAWRTIFSCYGQSPFFEYYAPQIERILTTKHKYLIDLDLDIFEFIHKTFALNCEVFRAKDFIRRQQDNYTDSFLVKNREQEGKEYKSYFQCFSDKMDFQPNLSCLDVLFCLGNESKDYIRNVRQHLLQH